ncbi:hypothetical protein N7466_010867 [Penicillium verhagenii]|uniref:uncharacterized protein n=1 Tax=Penicillium verhagenii TaxID=1562060 RepID=UPI0025459099|nr:uncharacterized protein N7466_010867 [Penicillium verhagenii]KAJ5917313.1 hypothetical protein N7466_010867 [Penicillium verhagenii]
MASIYDLNHPLKWDSELRDLEDHPFFSRGGHHHGPHHGPHAHHGPPGPRPFWAYGGPPHHGHHGHHGPPPPFWGYGGPAEHGHRGRHHRHGRRGESEQPENNEEVNVVAEQNAEATSSTEKVPEDQDKEVNSSSESDSDNHRGCRKDKHKGGKGRHGHDHVRGFGRGGRGGRCGKGRHGQDPEFGSFDPGYPYHGPHYSPEAHHGPHHGFHHGPPGPPPPFWGYGGPAAGPGPWGPHHHHHAHPMFGFGGPMGAMGHKGHKGHKGPKGHKGHKGHKEGRRGRGMRHGGPKADFMRQLSAFFGFPLGPRNDVEFQPSVDVFDTPANYIVHVSLPGAKKSDVNIDYDTQESVLRLTGTVHRPNMDESLQQGLVMEERAREVGTFEREIRLGSRCAPAPVIVEGIVAILEDGVLNVTIPKTEESESNKSVPIEVGNVDAVQEKDAMMMDEHVDRALTPGESEESESEEEAREYVKIAVQ